MILRTEGLRTISEERRKSPCLTHRLMARIKLRQQQQHVLADAHVRAARAAAAAAAQPKMMFQSDWSRILSQPDAKLRRRVPISIYQFVLGG
jgi:hypothetical protein